MGNPQITLIVQPIANTHVIMITKSARETLLNILTNRYNKLQWFEYNEAKDIKVIAQSYEFNKLVEQIENEFKV